MACSAPNGQCINHGACNMSDGCISRPVKPKRPLSPNKLVRSKKKKK